MAEIPLKWPLGCAVWLTLLVQFCTGKTPTCLIWTNQGFTVRRDTKLVVYCTFNCEQECKPLMYSGHPPAVQLHMQVNSTTTFFRMDNITEHRTFSCVCDCSGKQQQLCGKDIKAGYPPEMPQNILCKYLVVSNQTGEVRCSWERGRETHLKAPTELVTLVKDSSPPFQKSIRPTNPPSVKFSVSNRVHFISVQVRIHNALGSAESPPANYTLRDIKIPTAPVIEGAQCSSRRCNISYWQRVKTEHLEVQYATEPGRWARFSISNVPIASDQLQSNTNLEPFQLYHFRARAKFSTGLWSNWSNVISNWTEEEAPAKAPDVWYTRSSPESNSIRLYWKPMTGANARGKIIRYLVTVHFSNSGWLFLAKNISANTTSTSIALYPGCQVMVRALNSRGTSPPARISAYRVKASVLLDIQVKGGNHSVNITWKGTALGTVAHVVEWYREGLKLQELHWLRLAGEERQAVITGLNASECYKIAVNILYSDGTMTTRIFGYSTSQSAPQVGLTVQPEVDGNKVTVTWEELDRAQRDGCITNYTIYLEGSNGDAQQYSVPGTKRAFVLEDQPPGVHSLWMTAWNSKGESPPGQKVKFLIREGTSFFLLVGYPLLAVVFLLLCMCHITAVRKRLLLLFHCFMPQVVPDPANSKWAKECSQDKGKMKPQFQQSEAVATEEEEPIISIITSPEELSNQHTEEAGSPSNNPSILRKTLTIYIKSDSRDLDSSEQTQISLDSNSTTDDRTPDRHQAEEKEGVVEEENEEEEFAETLNSLPEWTLGTNPVEPQIFKKLTLDSVRIDCSNLFENC
ncbi:interleukin-12 receptor subunit beta-2 isoform X1 [Corythoichthys intestinalis]|uniref:interleukin-12 receptor subunit beta-2 isoform X1 n=1 Tax=Corythoichthys intestinalis TaxID=161448 RepID=UPI0025A676FF|nr:interleukin-12 receptor subunit beta-2 isoform X1 [Corythoichthys intestinalis]